MIELNWGRRMERIETIKKTMKALPLISIKLITALISALWLLSFLLINDYALKIRCSLGLNVLLSNVFSLWS
jgi:hypothetical protein